MKNRNMTNKNPLTVIEDKILKTNTLRALDFVERPLEEDKQALRGIKFALTYSGLEVGPAREFFEKILDNGESELRKLLGEYGKVSNKKRFIKQIAWGIEEHKDPKDPEFSTHFHVYLEFSRKLERRGLDGSDVFNIMLPGSSKIYKPDIESRKSLKEGRTWIGYCCKDKTYIASPYLNKDISVYARNKEWTDFMDSVYETAEKEGADAALDKLRIKNKTYFYRIRAKLRPELEELHKAYMMDHPKLYMPYKETDFDWTEPLVNLRVALIGGEQGLINLPSMVFLGRSNTGKSAAIRFILKKYILSGQVLMINSIEGLEGFRHGRHKLILMEDPAFFQGGSLKTTVDVLEALLSVDQQRDIRVLYKTVQKPVNIPVIITGNPEKMPEELGGEYRTSLGGLGTPRKPTEEEPNPDRRVDLDTIEASIERGDLPFDKDVPPSIIKRRFVYYITKPILKPEAAAHYARQKEALINPLQKREQERYDLEAHMKDIPELKRLISTEAVQRMKKNVVKPKTQKATGQEGNEKDGNLDFNIAGARKWPAADYDFEFIVK